MTCISASRSRYRLPSAPQLGYHVSADFAVCQPPNNLSEKVPVNHIVMRVAAALSRGLPRRIRG